MEKESSQFLQQFVLQLSTKFMFFLCKLFQLCCVIPDKDVARNLNWRWIGIEITGTYLIIQVQIDRVISSAREEIKPSGLSSCSLDLTGRTLVTNYLLFYGIFFILFVLFFFWP